MLLDDVHYYQMIQTWECLQPQSSLVYFLVQVALIWGITTAIALVVSRHPSMTQLARNNIILEPRALRMLCVLVAVDIRVLLVTMISMSILGHGEIIVNTAPCRTVVPLYRYFLF